MFHKKCVALESRTAVGNVYVAHVTGPTYSQVWTGHT